MKIRKVRRKKKGFTLVELIVVLVILAVLMAVLIPALLGYIDKARESKAIAEVHTVALAAQSGYAEWYGAVTERPPAGTINDQKYKEKVGSYMSDLMKSECGMKNGYSGTLENKNTNNNFGIVTSPMTKDKWDTFYNYVKSGYIKGNIAAIYLQPQNYDSIVGIIYVSQDMQYLVRIIYRPELTTDFKDEKAGYVYVEKIQ